MSGRSPFDEVRDQLGGLLPKLRRFARAIAHHPDDADDLVQMAVGKALARADQWRSGAPLEGWMFGIIKNAWVDELRARGRRAKVHAPEEAGLEVGDHSAADREIALSVQAAMATLPAEQRLAVALVLVEGLSYREAADTLHIPIGTLTSRLARAREALQALLTEARETPQ